MLKVSLTRFQNISPTVAADKNQRKSQRKIPTMVQWVTFMVLFSFVMGSVIIGGLSFRSGQRVQIPPPNSAGKAQATPEEDPVHHWQEIVKLNPKDPFALRNLARAFLNDGKFPEARKTAMEALKFSSSDSLNVELLGRIAAKEGKMDEAAGFFKKAVAADPNDPALLFDLAQSLTVSSKDREAKKYYEKVISIKPFSLEGIRSRLSLLNAAMYEKNYEEAKSQALALYSISPDDPRLLVKVGEIYEAQKDLSKALAYYERAKKAQPDDASLRTHLAELYFKMGKTSHPPP